MQPGVYGFDVEVDPGVIGSWSSSCVGSDSATLRPFLYSFHNAMCLMQSAWGEWLRAPKGVVSAHW